MKNWFRKLNERLDRWMSVRYGHDEFGAVLLGLGVFFLLLATIPDWQYVTIVALIPTLYASMRCFSKNIELRRKELEFYLKLKEELLSWISELSAKLQDRCRYKYVKCKHCGTVFRIPRGMGKVNIDCPHCGNKFITRS